MKTLFAMARRACSACVAVAITMTAATACAPEPPQAVTASVPFDTEVSMLELMVHVVRPAADRFWAGAGYIVDADGEHALRPSTPEGWKSVEDGAMTAMETANLMLLPGRLRAPESDWIRYVIDLRKVAKEAQLAAERKASEEEMLDIGGRLYDTCTACHEQFTNPQMQPTATFR